MILTVREIRPYDMRHLFCSDKRLNKEVARLSRSVYRTAESASPRHDGDRAYHMTSPPPRPAA